MGKGSKIEWCDHTFNPWRGCTKVSEGCQNCYAETLSKRNAQCLGVWGPQGTRVLASRAMWKEPLKWNEEAKQAGQRYRVFCASLADVGERQDTVHDHIQYAEIMQGRARLLELIWKTPHLDWLLLTKRPESWMECVREVFRFREVAFNESDEERAITSGIAAWIGGRPPANVWMGTSVENQTRADERIPELLKIPAKVRFLSCEPLLGPVDLNPWIGPLTWAGHRFLGCPEDGEESCRGCPCGGIECPGKWDRGIHWVIAGGESGPKARPVYPDGLRNLRDLCRSAGVAFFFKQWGEWAPVERTPDMRITMPAQNADLWAWPDGTKWGWKTGPVSKRIGKAAAGRLLDGRTWDEFPQAVGGEPS